MSENNSENNDLRYVSRNLPSRNEAHGVKSSRSHRIKKGKDQNTKINEDKTVTASNSKETNFSPLNAQQTMSESDLIDEKKVSSTKELQLDNQSEREEVKNKAQKKERKVTKSTNKDKKTSSNSRTRFILKEVLSWILTLVLAIALYFVITTFVAQKYQVKGSSMYPTLQDTEQVIGNKLEKIDRLDIVVFKAPDSGEEYVKRVIGLPGDSITYLDGKLFVNDQQIEEPFINTEEEIEINGEQTLGTGSFTLPQLTGEMVVPDDHYFVLGDNRGHSNDSRHFGFVKREAIHSVIRFIVWPIDKWHFFKTIPSP